MVRLEDVQWDSSGRTLAWLEGRSDRGVIVGRTGADAVRDLTVDHCVRAGVGYGGGDFTVSRGVLWYVADSGRLYRQAMESGEPVPLTLPFGGAASPAVSPDGEWVLFVHSCEGTDLLALADASGARWPIDLVRGADFYMQPAWHPHGDQIAWVEWDHPNMPWDGARLMLARLEGSPPRLVSPQAIAGGDQVPAFQPGFSPDGEKLAYLMSEGEWDQLVALDLVTGRREVLVDEAALLPPAWIQGLRVWGWLPDSRRICYLRSDRGFGSLWMMDLQARESTRLDTPPYTWLSQLSVSPTGEKVAFIGSAPGVPERIVVWQDGQMEVQRRSDPERLGPGSLPPPEPMTWSSAGGATVHGLYYAPALGDLRGAAGPPAIVNIHGGPTSQRVASFSADAAFFTSRGFVFLEVNHRGSTGFGRAYRLSLRGRWGDYDVEDAVSAARALSERGLGDPARLVIKGGSAGGYTVLNALARYPGVFRAGVCLYGVSNLFTFQNAGFKFEARYLDSLVGRLPEAADHFRAWSPIFHADRIRDPLAIFQGAEDRVVPPDQSESIVRALRERGVPCLYRLYAGEGHGWRKAETVAAYYAEVETFLAQYVLYA